MDVNIKEVLWEAPYIKLVKLEQERYCLFVQDTNLNDYVEDLLWDEYEYAETSVAIDAASGVPLYSNYFEPGIPIEKVLALLKGIDLTEVERIYRLNN